MTISPKIYQSVNVHRLIAEVWLINNDPDHKKDVIFIDGVKTNCHALNLKWATRIELIEHSYQLNKYSFYKPVVVTEIATNIVTICKSTREAAIKFDIHEAQVDACLSGKYTQTKGYKIRYLHPDIPRRKQAEFIDLTKFTNYIVTPYGEVYRKDTGLPIKTHKQNTGYITVTLINDFGKRSTIYVHRLVASIYVSNPCPKTKLYINHKDHNRSKNFSTNLEWVTMQENNIHSKEVICGNE